MKKKLENVLIIDTETTGVDPDKHAVIEVGCVLWSLEHRAMVETYSALLPGDSNEAEDANGIPPALLAAGDPHVLENVAELAQFAQAYVAHNADFDRGFLQPHRCRLMPWICTMEDFDWPVRRPKRALTEIALAHGVAVVAAHRAINDCLILARLFERLDDSAERLERALEHALLPRGRVVAKVPYEQRDLAKAEHFQWDPERKQWWRRMAIADAEKLPFPVKITEEENQE